MASDGKSKRTQRQDDGKGAPKKPAPRAPQSRGNRGGLSLDSEQSARLILFGAVALVMVIAAGFLIFGYWYSVVRPRNRTVLAVDGVTVSYQAMKRRMAYEFLTNTSYQTQTGAQILPQAAYQTLLNELTEVTQAESRLGITVTDEEAETGLRNRISVASSADQRTFADALRAELIKTGLKESELRRMVRATAIDTKILEKFKAEAPPTLEQARIDVIAVSTQDAAQQAIDRINGGEDFASVAKAVSTEPDAATTGGVHDYGPKGSFDPAYDAYAFSGEIGGLSTPLSSAASSGVFYVVRVLDRSDQPVQDSQKPAIASNNLVEWLKSTQDELQASGKITQDWADAAQSDALLSVLEKNGPKLVAQRQKQQEDQQKAEEVRQTTVAQLTASPQATPAAETTPAPGETPGAVSTPGDGTPAAEPSAAATVASGSSPSAPSQPVAPGSNGP